MFAVAGLKVLYQSLLVNDSHSKHINQTTTVTITPPNIKYSEKCTLRNSICKHFK